MSGKTGSEGTESKRSGNTEEKSSKGLFARHRASIQGIFEGDKTKKDTPRRRVPNIPLQAVLLSPQGVSLFAKFLESEFSVENLAFWIAINEFKISFHQNDGRDPTIVGREIFNYYVGDSATQLVNISGKSRQSLKNIFENNEAEIVSTIFDEAQNEVFLVLQRDSYHRFKQTEVFISFVETLDIDDMDYSTLTPSSYADSGSEFELSPPIRKNKYQPEKFTFSDEEA